MDQFKNESTIDFFDRYKTDKDCLAYLANIKWQDGFICVKCSYKKFTVHKANYSRNCNLCHHVESPTANTMFHKVNLA